MKRKCYSCQRILLNKTILFHHYRRYHDSNKTTVDGVDRQNRNIKERIRILKLTNEYAKLRSVIPFTNEKTNQFETLMMAMKYIRCLENVLDEDKFTQPQTKSLPTLDKEDLKILDLPLH